jgi:hypothetical protein
VKQTKDCTLRRRRGETSATQKKQPGKKKKKKPKAHAAKEQQRKKREREENKRRWQWAHSWLAMAAEQLQNRWSKQSTDLAVFPSRALFTHTVGFLFGTYLNAAVSTDYLFATLPNLLLFTSLLITTWSLNIRELPYTWNRPG